MELRASYKNTEVGIIPEDWEVKTIGEIFTFYSTSNFSKAEMALDGEVGCIHYGLIHAIDNTSYSLANGIKYYVTKEQAKYETVQNGDVVMVDASEDLVGLNKSIEVFDVRSKDYIAGLHTFHLRDKNQIFVDTFRGLVLNSDTVKKQMLKLAVGMKVFGVSKPQLQQILVPVPNPTEQTAIATALSDADALISSLEKLIAKKQSIKQGAMQKLLQPKEGWEVKKLGDIAELVTKGTTPTSLGRDFQSNGINFIKIESLTRNGEIIPDKVAYIDDFTHQLLKRSQLKCGDILFSIAGALGRVAVVNNEILPANTNQALAIIRLNLNTEIDFKYLFIYLKSIKIQTHILNVSVQGAQANLSLLNISELLIEIPKLKKEQTRIATILSDMDSEIAALETKLDKYRKVKQGMMQNLLTGKIRLV